jgi:NDP-sugar pyrophosphorylase family protein
MMEVLALFCGGPAIYDDGVPKPLRRVGGATLIEQYLRHGLTRQVDAVVLLCDASYASAFATIATQSSVPTTVSSTPDGASTFERARHFLEEAELAPDDMVHLAYPDVFTSFPLDVPSDVDLSRRLLISTTTLTSRFPRFFVDPYTNAIRGISVHTSQVPANPIHIFGGDVLGQAALLEGLMGRFAAATDNPMPMLEADFFAWAINESLAESLPLYGAWQQIDSPRDITALENRLDRSTVAE